MKRCLIIFEIFFLFLFPVVPLLANNEIINLEVVEELNDPAFLEVEVLDSPSTPSDSENLPEAPPEGGVTPHGSDEVGSEDLIEAIPSEDLPIHIGVNSADEPIDLVEEVLPELDLTSLEIEEETELNGEDLPQAVIDDEIEEVAIEASSEEDTSNDLIDSVDIPEENSLADPSSFGLVINEVMLGSEKNPEKDLWIEFYNSTAQSIDLTGWQIRGITKGNSWVDLVNQDHLTIDSEGYFLLSRYSNSASSALAVKPDFIRSNFVLPDPSQVIIQLKNPQGELVDSFEASPQLSDEFHSYQRHCDQPNSWEQSTIALNLKEELPLTFATPLASHCEASDVPVEPSQAEKVLNMDSNDVLDDHSNEGEVSPEPIYDTVRVYPNYQLINEVMVNPSGSDKEGEWVELYNPTDDFIDLMEWYLDDAEGGSALHKIDRSLNPKSYLVLRGPNLNLSFKNTSDQIRLLNPNKEVVHVVQYTDAKEDYSYARKSSGLFEWTPILTMDRSNEFPPPPKLYDSRSILIKKVLANPDGSDSGQERIVFKNRTDELIELSGWAIQNQKGKMYYFEDESIESHQSFSFNPSTIGLILANKSDHLLLLDGTGHVVDQIQWTKAPSGEWIFYSQYFEDDMVVPVNRVIDGDTLEILYDDEVWKVRLIGIDAPETIHPEKPVDPMGRVASDYLKFLLEGHEVRLSFEADKFDTYGRLIAYVWRDELLVNTDLVQKGLAKVYTKFPFRHQEDFLNDEAKAKAAHLRIWKTPSDKKIADEPVLHDEDKSIVEEVSLIKNDEMDDYGEGEPVIPTCNLEGLSIHAILPNEEKGKTVEYIQLINNTDQTLCLNGWSLDDDLGKGSKPYVIDASEVSAGGLITFLKTQTKISLNNSNDCANLIHPSGRLIDSICYKRTKKGQIITHDTLASPTDDNPQVSAKKTASTKRVSVKMNREPVSFKWDLKNETLSGKVAFIYDEGKVFYLKNDQKIFPISYANSQVSLEMAKQLIDLSEPVQLEVRTAGPHKELIGIQALNLNQPNSHLESVAYEWIYGTFFIFLIGLFLSFYYFRDLLSLPFLP